MPAIPVNNAPKTASVVTSISTDDLRRICRELDLVSHLEQIFLIGDAGILTCGRIMDPAIADGLVKRVRSTWDAKTQTAQIQYAQLSKYDEPLVLFTRPLATFLLTLAARSETSVSVLSHDAELLSARLLLSPDLGSTSENRRAADVTGAYAIAWRPVEPMSRAMRQAVKLSAEEVAKEKGCHLTFVGVASDHVHLVMRCPPRRTSSWAAHSFKSAIEEDIQRQFDIPVGLWRKGYLASPSAEPLAGEELLTYLSGAP